MKVRLKLAKDIDKNVHTVILLSGLKEVEQYCAHTKEEDYVRNKLQDQQSFIAINQYNRFLIFVAPVNKPTDYAMMEAYRRIGYQVSDFAKKEKLDAIQVVGENKSDILCTCEGTLLSAYTFAKYKTEQSDQSLLSNLQVIHQDMTEEDLDELENIVEATCIARDLVNEPAISLDAIRLSEAFVEVGQKAGFSVEVLDESKIQALKMGGLLGVNAGSQIPPTFNVMEYKPENAVNTKPYVIVGKGVTYDTGGLSLKPSESMEIMKCDMGGAAAVVGTMAAIATNRLPIHIVGLVPATDNRPGENAIVPGDVITISNGSTVEVLNTDAEGRLILADALSYAQKYDPTLVIDLATLTGAALVALGKEGAVMMGTANDSHKNMLKEAGEQVYERMAELPMWEEYKEYLKSDIADIKNIGGRTAGAITAGVFLQHFTNYEWMHLDIAGPAYLTSPDNYRGKNGTGMGVRLLYQFFKNIKNI